jgi:small conductance mechanosensitive channel
MPNLDLGNLFNVQDVTQLGGDIVRAIIVVLLALFVARLGRRAVRKAILKARPDQDLAALVGNVVYAGVFVLAAIAILQVFSINLTAVVATVGVIGLAITFAVQDLLKNFVAGMYLLLERPFHIGDRIRVRDIDGFVESVEFRTTILRTDSGLQVVVPNAILFGEILTNRTAYGIQQITIRLELPQADLEEVQSEAQKVLAEHATILDAPEPRVAVEGVTDGRLVVRLEFWVVSGTVIGPQTILALQAAFPSANLTVA